MPASSLSSLFRYRDLIAALVGRELKVRYRRSAIGFLWTMLQPMLMMLALYAVFSSIFRVDLANYQVYVLSGLLFWNFFSQSIVSAMNSLRGNALLLQKVAVPRAVFPVATVLAGVVNLVLALVPLAIILLVTGHRLTPALFFLPVAIVVMTVFTLGAGLLLAPLAVFFSDVVELIGVLLSLLMFLTPIFYPKSIVPANLAWLVRFNPARSILEVFRDPIYHGKLPPLTHLSAAVLVALLALAVGSWAFSRSSSRIPFYV